MIFAIDEPLRMPSDEIISLNVQCHLGLCYPDDGSRLRNGLPFAKMKGCPEYEIVHDMRKGTTIKLVHSKYSIEVRKGCARCSVSVPCPARGKANGPRVGDGVRSVSTNAFYYG